MCYGKKNQKPNKLVSKYDEAIIQGLYWKSWAKQCFTSKPSATEKRVVWQVAPPVILSEKWCQFLNVSIYGLVRKRLTLMHRFDNKMQLNFSLRKKLRQTSVSDGRCSILKLGTQTCSGCLRSASTEYNKEQHDIAETHTARLILKEIQRLACFPHPPYSPNPAPPSEYHFFRFINDQMQGHRLESKADIQQAVQKVSFDGWRGSSNFQSDGKSVKRNGKFVY